jgi:hypothetical protein
VENIGKIAPAADSRRHDDARRLGDDAMVIGILAYGSLLDDPGAELGRLIVRRIDGIKTPFTIEFARSSRTRDGGPTLVPVETGGAAVSASVLVLRDSVDEELARDMLYRRETWSDRSYRDAASPWIDALPDFNDVDVCLYTALEPCIEPLTTAHLARLAIESARRGAGAKRRDGISYLIEQKRRGVMTPLMPGYEAEILTLSGARDLADAWARARAGRRSTPAADEDYH